MNVIEIIVSLIILVVLFLFVGDTTIELKPFSVTVENWHKPLCIFGILFLIIFYGAIEKRKGVIQGAKLHKEIMDKQLEDLREHSEKEEDNVFFKSCANDFPNISQVLQEDFVVGQSEGI